ncbi:MAG: hypothetical protein ACO2Z7_04790 [Burkholderiaceae bacterium]
MIYDVRLRDGSDYLLAKRYQPDGQILEVEAPDRRNIGKTGWRINRQLRHAGPSPTRIQTLEDTPFYARSMVSLHAQHGLSHLMHETLQVDRLISPAVQWMLPWRMPRRR